MQTLRFADIAAGVLVSVLGVVGLLGSMQIQWAADQRLRPGAAPTLLSAMIIGSGLLLAFLAWRRRSDARVIDWPDGDGIRVILVTLASLIAYLMALEPVGFPVSSMLFVAFLVWYLGRYRPWVPVLLGLASAGVILVLFIDLLGLGYPLGLLELFY